MAKETKGTKRGAAKILRKAAKLLEKGWTQGNFVRFTRDADGNDSAAAYCAIGALHAADSGNPYYDQYSLDASLARKALRTAIGGGIIVWNDAGGRTKSEVVKAFRKTARDLEHGMQVSQWS